MSSKSVFYLPIVICTLIDPVAFLSPLGEPSRFCTMCMESFPEERSNLLWLKLATRSLPVCQMHGQSGKTLFCAIPARESSHPIPMSTCRYGWRNSMYPIQSIGSSNSAELTLLSTGTEMLSFTTVRIVIRQVRFSNGVVVRVQGWSNELPNEIKYLV